MKGFDLTVVSPANMQYETVFANGQELCVCCNSNIEPPY